MTLPARDSSAASTPESVQSAKSELRRALLAARRQRSIRRAEQEQRTAAVLALQEVQACRVVAGYAALRAEPDVGPALDALRARGVRVLLPTVKADLDLDFHDGAGVLTPLGAADVVLVPAVAADRAGRRLGRGGGSYDRALRRVRADALTVAVVHPEELLDVVPAEAHDLPVTAVMAGAELIRTS